MKKIFFTVVLMIAIVLHAGSAQVKSRGGHILHTYYALKDALVGSNAALANSKAGELVKAVTDSAALPEINRAALIKDAAGIAGTKDLKKQRKYFSSLSEQMFVLVKAVKMDSKPIYKAYCPMAKASWLSNAAAIKNPYYGSAMLTCGSVTETLK